MRSFLSSLSRLAVCWLALVEESGKAPYPQRAIWLQQIHVDANLLVSFSLFFSFCCCCSQGPLHCSCKLRPGPSEGKGSFGAHIYYGIVPPKPRPLVGVRTSLLSLVGLWSCNVRTILSNGNQAIMLHMQKSDRCRGFTTGCVMGTKAASAPRGWLNKYSYVSRT